MPVVNRRNAVVGYFVLLIFKRALWRRAQAAAEREERSFGRPLIGAAALIGLSAAGAAIAWRLRSGHGGENDLP
jgi:hypothetical protein